MLSAVMASASIVVISLLFGTALLVAWRQFGLNRHAVLWALSFMAAAVGHGSRVATVCWPTTATFNNMLGCLASFTSFALLAWGFRHRAGRGSRGIQACWALVTAALLGMLVLDHDASLLATRITTAIGDMAMVVVIIGTLRPARPAAVVTRWLFLLYALYIAGVGVAVWLARPGGEISMATYIVVLSIGTPTGMFATGILTLLIVSADLAGDLRRQARTDPLTGLLNRRGLEEDAARLAGTDPLPVVVADLDHFKAINDRLGHAAGDEVLRCFAAHLRAALHRGELVARMGGEEFVLVLPGTRPIEVLQRIGALRAGVPAALDGLTGGPVTASFGIALARPGEALFATVARADAALYRSKREGRDRVTLDQSAPPPASGQAFPTLGAVPG